MSPTTRKRPTTSKKKRTTTSRSRGASSASSIKITTYNTALRWLFSHTDHERMRKVHYNKTTFDLDRMRKLLRAMGNPQEQLKIVHIAGSKGKGSTCAMLESMLRASGYTVGLYSSPHLVDLRERIKVNGEMIGQTDLTHILKTVADKTKRWRVSDRPSFFEIMTAAAAVYFAEQAVDIAVLETGLGGRLDATNVFEPLVCGVTQISYDHADILGKDLPTIAREKAGIFKENVPAITVQQTDEVTAAMREVAEEVGAPLQFAGQDIEFSYRFEASRDLGPHTRVCMTTPIAHYEHLPVPLKGEHQALNCGLAIAILDKLRGVGFEAPDAKIIEGLAETAIEGRMELAWPEPRILLDGAHNAASMTALIKAIGAHIPYDSLVMVFGCAQDKDVRGMLEQVNLGADKIIFTRAKKNPRAVEPEDLLSEFGEVSEKMAQLAPNLEEALNLAARAVSREDLICVTGSFYLVGEAKQFLKDLAAKRAAAAEAN